MSEAAGRVIPRKMGLGRGLDALLGEAIREKPPISAAALSGADGTERADGTGGPNAGITIVNIADIHPNPHQPRRHFAADALAELAQSIARHGVIQPILVRPHDTHGTHDRGYQIVAGERRWRAAQQAQIHTIPVIVRKLDDAETLEIALIENIQRQDLNPIEEAEAYKRLCEEFGHSQAALAEIVQKSRSHVANIMRLLDLPMPLRDLVIEGRLQMGHARALLGSDRAVELAAIVMKKGLSVRATEALVRKDKGGDSKKLRHAAAIRDDRMDADIRAVETHLTDLLGLKVTINQQATSGAGAVTFQYANLDQLDMLCQRLTGENF